LCIDRVFGFSFDTMLKYEHLLWSLPLPEKLTKKQLKKRAMTEAEYHAIEHALQDQDHIRPGSQYFRLACLLIAFSFLLILNIVNYSNTN